VVRVPEPVREVWFPAPWPEEGSFPRKERRIRRHHHMPPIPGKAT
jgi:hypothetical protein